MTRYTKFRGLSSEKLEECEFDSLDAAIEAALKEIEQVIISRFSDTWDRDKISRTIALATTALTYGGKWYFWAEEASYEIEEE